MLFFFNKILFKIYYIYFKKIFSKRNLNSKAPLIRLQTDVDGYKSYRAKKISKSNALYADSVNNESKKKNQKKLVNNQNSASDKCSTISFDICEISEQITSV